MIRKSDLQYQIDKLFEVVGHLERELMLYQADNINLARRINALEKKECSCKTKKQIPVKKTEQPADKLEVAVGTITMAINKEAFTKKTLCCASEDALDKAIKKQKKNGYKVKKTSVNKKGQYIATLEKKK